MTFQNMISCRGLLTQLPALSAWYPSSITSHQSFVIYIAYQCLIELNVKYCYSSTELSWLWPLSYLKKLLSFKESGSYNWRSNTSHELKVSKTKCKTLGDRAFVRVGPSPWNPFALSIRSIRSVQGFKQALKTFFFVWHLPSELIRVQWLRCFVLLSFSLSALSVMC